MKTAVKQLLETGAVDLFIGYRNVGGHALPHCFVKERLDQLEILVTGPERYPLEKFAARLAAHIPDIKIGILARDCNRRAVNVLCARNQIDPDRIVLLDVNCCPSNLKPPADCSYLSTHGAASRNRWTNAGQNTDTTDASDQAARFSQWMYEFEKCIKCYGCRNICPVCYCTACSLTQPDLIETGALPPEAPVFHLVRAVHMAGRCVDCGLCEDACPVDIPLRRLYSKVNEIVLELFDYNAGADPDQPLFSLLGDMDDHARGGARAA